MTIEEIQARSLKLRNKYHELELQQNKKVWTVEEDALAYLTDAALVGRHTMSQQNIWKKENTNTELEHKLGENIWWLIVLADRMDIDIKVAIENFLTKTEKLLDK